MRIRRSVRHLVDDLHCKLAKFLCEHYHVVLLLPKFETRGMIRRGQRRIKEQDGAGNGYVVPLPLPHAT